MKICVLGAGAVGSAVGGLLANAGHEVALIGRKSHMDAIRAGGLKINGIFGASIAHPAVLETIPDNGYDLIILTVKSYDTEKAVAELSRHYPDARILNLQNGIGNYETLENYFPEESIYSGMIIIGFEIPEDGAVNITVYGGDVMIGRYGRPQDSFSQEIAEIFNATPIKAKAVDHIESWLWGKLLYNASLNPLGAVLDVPYGRLLEPAAWSIIRVVLLEIFAVTSAYEIPMLWRTADEYASALRERLIPATALHRSSMLADLRKGHKTEIDFLNGAVCRMGAEKSVPTPVNQTLVEQIRFLEAKKDR